jgi:hypothetical protein
MLKRDDADANTLQSMAQLCSNGSALSWRHVVGSQQTDHCCPASVRRPTGNKDTRCHAPASETDPMEPNRDADVTKLPSARTFQADPEGRTILTQEQPKFCQVAPHEGVWHHSELYSCFFSRFFSRCCVLCACCLATVLCNVRTEDPDKTCTCPNESGLIIAQSVILSAAQCADKHVLHDV